MSENKIYNDRLRKFIKDELRMAHFGVAEMENLRDYLQPEIANAAKGLDNCIVASLELSTDITATINEHPTLIYKHHYAQLNYLLDRNALMIAECIIREGYRAMPIPASQVLDFKQQLGHFSHRHAAALAGIGWIGKNNLLVTPEYGSHQRIVTILTNIPLETGAPIENGCGDCRLCIEHCPAEALSDENGYDFDKCYQMLNKFRGIRGIGHHICGFCIKPCKGTVNRKPA